MQTRRLSLWLVALALVAAQTLGLVHRVAHPSAATPGATTSTGWAQDFYAGHDGEPVCQLFDQLNASGVIPDVAALAPLVAVPLYFLSWFQGEALARWATVFDARGPPDLR